MDRSSSRLGHRKISRENLDRFIPNRSAMDFEYANYVLCEALKYKRKSASLTSISRSSELYRKQLAEALNLNRTRILAFKDKLPNPADRALFPPNFFHHRLKPVKPIRLIPQTPQRTLDAPGLENDYFLNILDWSSNNVIAIAFGNTVYLWDASNNSVSELVTVEEENGPVTSVSWAPNGQHIAVGLNNSEVQLWDFMANQQLRTLRGGHRLRVGSIAWNDHILTTGGGDGKILNHDQRVPSQVFGTYSGHHGEVCGLKWSTSGKQLASGGNDNLLHIWDKSMAFSNSPRQWLHKLEDHLAAVKAIDWCPSQANLLASGGGSADRCIKFWNTSTGVCLNSYDTGSQISALLWSKNELELLSSHGLPSPQLTLWKYPSMVKMAELTAHTHAVLFMAQSPDGCQVASAEGGTNEKLMIWNVFESPGATKPAPKANPEPFANFNRIR